MSAAIRKALHHKEDWPCVLVEALAKSEIECCRLSRLAEYRKRRIKKLVRMKTPNTERLRSPDRPRAGDKQDALVGDSSP